MAAITNSEAPSARTPVPNFFAFISSASSLCPAVQINPPSKSDHPFGQHCGVTRGNDEGTFAVRTHDLRDCTHRRYDGGATERHSLEQHVGKALTAGNLQEDIGTAQRRQGLVVGKEVVHPDVPVESGHR